MGLEAWGDDDDPGPHGLVTRERAEEIFVAGLQAMREMLARFVERGDPRPDSLGHTIANSLRLNWNPSWGPDPGRPDRVIGNCWET